MTIVDGLAVVRYDFNHGEVGVDYELYLYGSHNNFLSPLQFTTGDVGKKIRLGPGKVIYWDAKKELGNFKGDFSLRIKGSKYIPYVSFTNISEDLAIRRGQVFDVKWNASDKSTKVLIKLQRNGVPLSESLVVDNNGLFAWEIPSKAKAGKGYSVQISNTENALQEETSAEFSLKRKIPLVYKLVPLAVIAGTTAIVLLNNNTNESGIPEPPNAPEY